MKHRKILRLKCRLVAVSADEIAKLDTKNTAKVCRQRKLSSNVALAEQKLVLFIFGVPKTRPTTQLSFPPRARNAIWVVPAENA